jgi:hypothetical protein
VSGGGAREGESERRAKAADITVLVYGVVSLLVLLLRLGAGCTATLVRCVLAPLQVVLPFAFMQRMC